MSGCLELGIGLDWKDSGEVPTKMGTGFLCRHEKNVL